MELLKNFERDDCKHYNIVQIRACCNRSKMAGFCTIEDADGLHRNKVCSTKLRYCKYEPKEVDNVHSEKLPDTDG